MCILLLSPTAGFIYISYIDHDLKPYLTNPWARAEEIAYLTVMTVTSTALRDRAGAKLAQVIIHAIHDDDDDTQENSCELLF